MITGHKRYILIAAGLIISYAVMHAVFHRFTGHGNHTATSTHEIRGKNQYDMLNPEVVAEDFYQVAAALEADLVKEVEQLKKMGEVESVGVFYRDLHTGYNFGINEHQKFVPASLLKLPTAIAFYSMAEENPDILNKKIIYNPQTDANALRNISEDSLFIPGQAYSIQELINHAIINSDNNAVSVLIDSVDDAEYLRLFSKLGVELPDTLSEESLSTKDFASLFRMLYNVTFLNAENSQKLLDLLKQVKYKKALTAELPDDVIVAHKFGERAIQKDANSSVEKQYLHDCGIVYADHPYILCVMTEGGSLPTLEKTISKISKKIYDVVAE